MFGVEPSPTGTRGSPDDLVRRCAERPIVNQRRRLGPLPEVALVLVLTMVAFGFAQQDTVLAAPAADEGGSGPSTGAGGVGAALYGRDCAGCHGPSGDGSPRGVALTDSGEAAAHYMIVTGRMPIEDADDPIRRSTPRYSDAEIDALVDLVAGFGDGPDLPELEPTRGDVSEGGQLYRLHCGQCHGATGFGGALAFEQFAPDLMDSSSSVVAAALVTGPGAMPSFTGPDFTDDELASVVAYVQELQDPVNEGGVPVSRWGRVSEAAFLWVVVMPTLLLMAAWLARRVR